MSSPATQVSTPKPAVVPGELFSSPKKRTLVVTLALALLAILAYYPIGKNAFINFDDNQYIVLNPHLRSGLSWEGVKWAFTTFDAGNWHPLTWLSHALDYELFGLTPAGHHFVSVLLHALNVVLLFLVLMSLTKSLWRSLAVAALFAVHPLNVESVAWAAERKTLLSTFFFLVAISVYVRYVRAPAIRRYCVVAGAFALALMSKPQVITFPFVLLLLDYWPLQRTRLLRARSATGATSESFSWLTLEKVPLLVLSGLSAVITLRAQRAGNAVRSITEYSLPLRIENAIISYVLYVRDTFFPRHLAPIYPHPTSLFAPWAVILAATVLIAISVLAIIARKRAPYLLVGWFWFLGILVPMIGLVQVGLQARADRYMYVPLMGILVVSVWGCAELLAKFRISQAWAVSACAVAIVVFSVLTFVQVELWRNSETLWNYTLSVTQDNFMAEDNLAQELANQGRTQEALVHFHRILYMHNWSATDLIAFGSYEQGNGYAADAIKQYQRAAQNASDASTRAIALSDIGSAYLDLKNLNEAGDNFAKALQSDPNYVPALTGAGLVAQKTGDLELAIRDYTKAVSIQPTDLACELLGRAYQQSGRLNQANQAYADAQRLSRDYPQTHSLAAHLLAP